LLEKKLIGSAKLTKMTPRNKIEEKKNQVLIGFQSKNFFLENCQIKIAILTDFIIVHDYANHMQWRITLHSC
jgi:hypothetical protein